MTFISFVMIWSGVMTSLFLFCTETAFHIYHSCFADVFIVLNVTFQMHTLHICNLVAKYIFSACIKNSFSFSFDRRNLIYTQIYSSVHNAMHGWIWPEGAEQMHGQQWDSTVFHEEANACLKIIHNYLSLDYFYINNSAKISNILCEMIQIIIPYKLVGREIWSQTFVNVLEDEKYYLKIHCASSPKPNLPSFPVSQRYARFESENMKEFMHIMVSAM